MTASLLNTLRKRSTIQSGDLCAAGAAGPCSSAAFLSAFSSTSGTGFSCVLLLLFFYYLLEPLLSRPIVREYLSGMDAAERTATASRLQRSSHTAFIDNNTLYVWGGYQVRDVGVLISTCAGVFARSRG